MNRHQQDFSWILFSNNLGDFEEYATFVSDFFSHFHPSKNGKDLSTVSWVALPSPIKAFVEELDPELYGPPGVLGV